MNVALEFRIGTLFPLIYPWTKVPLKGKWFLASDLSLEMSGLQQYCIFTGKGEVTFIEHLLGARNFCMVSCFRGIVVH